MPNPSSGVSPDLDRIRQIPGCGPIHGLGRHPRALAQAWTCDDCAALLCAAIRAETLEEAATTCEAMATDCGVAKCHNRDRVRHPRPGREPE